MNTPTTSMARLANKMMRSRLARIAQDRKDERLLHAALCGAEIDIAEAIFASSEPAIVLHESLAHLPQRDAVVNAVFNSAPEDAMSHNVLCLVYAAVSAAMKPGISVLEEVRSIVTIIRQRTRDARKRAKNAA